MSKSQIIKDLANSSVDTLTALKRTKVLLSELDDKELLTWINNEISGYNNNANLPSYRHVQGTLRGTFTKLTLYGYETLRNVSIPLGKMPENLIIELLNVDFFEGIGALLQLQENSEKTRTDIVKVIPADIYVLIAKYNNDPFMNIASANVVVGTQEIQGIFSIVENKLLDILMKLEKEFGNLDELDIDPSQKTPDELKSLNHELYLIVYNDNRITIGNENKIKDSTIASNIK